MTKQKNLLLEVVCFFAVTLFVLNGIGVGNCVEDVTSDRTYLFVTQALQLHVESGGNGGGYAVVESGSANKWVTEWSYRCFSEDAHATVLAEYMAQGEGLYFVTINTTQSSENLPLCLQPSARALDRAKDFLTRYKNWVQDANLTNIIGTLDTAEADQNCSVVVGDLNLTITSNRYATVFYWGYTTNGTYNRGLGITFVGNYTFFRDDRNLLLPAREPPANIFNSASPYISTLKETEPLATRSVNESFSFMTPRPAAIMELYLDPEANISAAVKEVRQFSGYFTFNLQEPLQPNTVYTATLLCGQSAPPNIDMAPLVLLSWQFITENATQTTQVPSQTQTSSQHPTTTSEQTPNTTTPSTTPFEASNNASAVHNWIYVTTAAVMGAATVALAIITLRRKKQNKI